MDAFACVYASDACVRVCVCGVIDTRNWERARACSPSTKRANINIKIIINFIDGKPKQKKCDPTKIPKHKKGDDDDDEEEEVVENHSTDGHSFIMCKCVASSCFVSWRPCAFAANVFRETVNIGPRDAQISPSGICAAGSALETNETRYRDNDRNDGRTHSCYCCCTHRCCRVKCCWCCCFVSPIVVVVVVVAMALFTRVP